MDLNYKLYFNRADNELKLANIIFQVSDNKKMQEETFNVGRPETYFSSVITHSYYCIFYSAKAYLLKKEIKIGVYFWRSRDRENYTIAKFVLPMRSKQRISRKKNIYERNGECLSVREHEPLVQQHAFVGYC